MPTTDVVDFLPATLPSVKRTELTGPTPRTLRSASTSAGGVSPKPLFAPTVRSPANARSTARSIEPRSPAAKIVTNTTSATPTISAAAVTAVRAGLRVEFSRARRPVTPVSRCSGAPMSDASGRTSCGLKSATPRKTATDPRPSSAAAPPPDPPPKSPYATMPAPPRPSTAAAINRPRPARGAAVSPSRSAAIGAMRVARSAGTRLAMTVTTTPTSSDTTIVRVAMTDAVAGRSAPIALNSARRRGHERDAAEQPGERREQADDGGLEHDRAQHLAARRAEHPQQRELARALRDGDRERVVDHERADEQRDAAEDEQRRAKEAELVLEVGGLSGGVLGAGAHLDGLAAQLRAHAAAQDRRRDAIVAGDGDRAELAALAGHRLCGRQRRDRDRVAGDRRLLAEARGADEREAAQALLADDLHAVAELEVLLVDGVLVEADLGGALRRTAADEAKLLERRGLQRRDEAAVADRLAVLVADPDVAEDRAGRRRDAVDGAHALDDAARPAAAGRRRSRRRPCPARPPRQCPCWPA